MLLLVLSQPWLLSSSTWASVFFLDFKHTFIKSSYLIFYCLSPLFKVFPVSQLLKGRVHVLLSNCLSPGIFSLLSYPLFVIMKCSFHHCISYLYLLAGIHCTNCIFLVLIQIRVCVCVIYIYIPAVHVYGRFLMNFFFLNECISLDLLSLIIQDKCGQIHHKTIFLLVKCIKGVPKNV